MLLPYALHGTMVIGKDKYRKRTNMLPITHSPETLHTMTHDELVAYCLSLQTKVNEYQIDQAFGILNRTAAYDQFNELRYKWFIMIDIANMHAANHTYTMAGVDQRINAVINTFRSEDTYRHGGDEICIIVDRRTDINAFLNRIDTAMAENNLYGVYAAVYSDETTIDNAAQLCDMLLMIKKTMIDRAGMKPGRDEPYRKLDSHFIIVN